MFLMNLENGYDFDSEEKRENWKLCLCDVACCEWNPFCALLSWPVFIADMCA